MTIPPRNSPCYVRFRDLHTWEIRFERGTVGAINERLGTVAVLVDRGGFWVDVEPSAIRTVEQGERVLREAA